MDIVTVKSGIVIPQGIFFNLKHDAILQFQHVTDAIQRQEMAFLNSDAVFYTAGQKEQILQLQSCVLVQDVIFNFLQLLLELIDKLQGLILSEVVFGVLAQRNLSQKNRKQTVHFNSLYAKALVIFCLLRFL